MGLKLLPRRTPKPGKLVRGYRIHVYRGGSYSPPSYTTTTMWCEKPPVEQWQRVIADPTTQQAWMIQSGKRMKQFQFRR